MYHDPNFLFIEIKELRPGQVRYSSILVKEKIEKLRKKMEQICYKNCEEIILANLKPKDLKVCLKLFPVIKCRIGYILLDGHHNIIARYQLGGTLIPVKVVADLSHLNESLLWETLVERQLAHLNNCEGKKLQPIYSLKDLIDDPNRYLATLLCQKEDKTHRYAIWVKDSDTPPFIEFRISEVFWSAQIVYDKLWSSDYIQSQRKYFRKILFQAKIPKLKLLDL